ncbi:acetate and sugar kinases/Hsc70/actin family protein [Niallia taxi]|uniref:hypothetical protein n=1 Tax=Niallia taxi TaxID=2499688 RepID=UPI0015F5D9F4|nr:hypothetical protein [Niallia taxi]
MEYSLHLNVSNDIGNNEQGMIINGERVFQPHVFAHDTNSNKFNSTNNVVALVDKLMENISVTISSQSVHPGKYAIGRYVIDGDFTPFSMDVGMHKSESEIPILTTTGTLAAYAVKKAFEDKGVLPELINLTVDMATAIPASEYVLKETAQTLEAKFMTKMPHYIRVHVGDQEVSVNVKYTFVKVAAEGVLPMLALMEDSEGNVRDDDIFDEFRNEYGEKIAKEEEITDIDGEYFDPLRILQVDVGEGTTEVIVSQSYSIESDFVTGVNAGVGHAIEKAIPTIEHMTGLNNLTRQNISDYIKSSLPKYRKYKNLALLETKKHVKSTVDKIVTKVKQQIRKANNDIDVIMVYGGGSIILRDELYPALKAICEEEFIDAKLLWIPAKYAASMNADGLNLFVHSDEFKGLKDEFLSVNKKVAPALVASVSKDDDGTTRVVVK